MPSCAVPFAFELSVDATQTSCCGQLFCRNCIMLALSATSLCPKCRSECHSEKSLFRDVRGERSSKAAIRGCPHQACSFRGDREGVRNHLDSCEFRPRQTRESLERANTNLTERVRELKAQIALGGCKICIATTMTIIAERIPLCP